MGQGWFLTSDHNIKCFLEEVKKRQESGEKVCVQFVAPERTPDQNALLHKIVRIAAEQLGSKPEEMKRMAKLHIGVPILREKNDEFREKYDLVIKESLSYEQKLQAMDLLPVTSLMKKDEFGRMIDNTLELFINQGVDFGELHGN